ncbi:MAG: hypothetical protein Q9159_007345 [Coniocarpon cinnabarinum]
MPPTKPPRSDSPHTSNEDTGDAEAEKNFQPKSLNFWLILSGLYLSIFLVGLDRIIIATAIPSITDRFNSINDIGWYGSAYMLGDAILTPLFGRIYQLYPTKWVFLVSLVVFEAGSALCGAAPSSAAFIVGRIIAGAGAAGIFCGGIMIIVPLVPLRKRPVFTSIFGIAFSVSSVLGPLVGGAFTDNSFTVIAVLLFLDLKSPTRERGPLFEQVKQLDPIGLVFFVPSMVCLILALQWGGTTYSWADPKIIGLLVTFSLTFLGFLVTEAMTPATAMAPARVVLNRSVAGAMTFMFLLSGGMMIVLYYLTIWFQAAQGQSAMAAGIRTFPLVLSLVLFSILAGILTQKVGYCVPAMLMSPIFCSVGGGLLSTLTPRAGSNQWIGYQVIYGLGIGAGFQTSTLVPQAVLPRADVSLGMALMFFMQQIGGSVFLSVAQNIFSNQLVDRISGLADINAEAIINTGATALRSAVPPNMAGTIVDAYSFAVTRVFFLTAALSAATIVSVVCIEWKSIKAKDATNGAADGEKGDEAPETE